MAEEVPCSPASPTLPTLPILQTAPTDGGPTKRARRPALSCVECRLRKVKCDRNKPCGACIRIKSDKCTYRPLRAGIRATASAGRLSDAPQPRASVDAPPPPSPSPARPNSPPNPSPNLPSDFDLLVNRYVAPGIFGAHGKLQFRPLPNQSSSNSNADSVIASLQRRVNKLEEKLERQTGTLPVRTSPPHPADPAPGTFSKSRYRGQSHWANAIEPYEALGEQNVTADPATDRVNINKSTALYKIVTGIKCMARIVRNARLPLQPPGFSDDALTSLLPERNVCDALIDCYLRTFEKVFRIIHVPSFRRDYDDFWCAAAPAKPPVLLKMLLVCAIGVPFYTGAEKTRLRILTGQWIRAAENWLSLSEVKLWLNMSGLQIQLLLLLARQVCNAEGDFVWIGAGSMLRTAMFLGLHRDPSHFPKVSVFHGEMRRRLWATVLEITVQSSLDMGMPPMISVEDYDTKVPTNINDDDFNEGSTTLDEKPNDQFTQSSIQISLASTLPTRFDIIRQINNLRFDLPYTDVLHLGASLTTTCLEHMTFFKSALPHTNPFQIKLADTLIRRFILCLHRPYFAKATSDPRYHYSRKACLDASLALFAPAVDPTHQSHQPADDWTLLTHQSVGFLKASLLYAMSTVYYELNTQIAEHQSMAPLFGTANTNTKSLPPQLHDLYAVLATSHQIALARVKNGEPNGKAVVFLACALARIDALVSGANAEAAILQAARAAVTDIAHILTNVYFEENGRTVDLSGCLAAGNAEYGGVSTATTTAAAAAASNGTHAEAQAETAWDSMLDVGSEESDGIGEPWGWDFMAGIGAGSVGYGGVGDYGWDFGGWGGGGGGAEIW